MFSLGRSLVAGAIFGAIAAVASAPIAHASPEGGLEDLQERIVRLCNEAWGGDPAREQQCRNDNMKELQDYVSLINQYPPNSRQYQVLIGCSQQYPEAVVMWMMCANLEMPEEPNFRPFDTGPTPVEALRQYRAAQPGPLSPANPDALPETIRNLPNYELFPSAGQTPSFAAPGSAQPVGQPTQVRGGGQRPQTFTPPSALPAPTTGGGAVQQAPSQGGSVYIPGVRGGN
ncbi:MAG: hypothetical protein KI792_04140 [Alphaproteobacteria bacterium]|nr:hypothetical protein [Alphaproteobacteria bacterium SS10]